MTWDRMTLALLASFGLVTLLLMQIGEVLSKLPPIIRAWRRVRDELSGGGRSEGRGEGEGGP
ncbi:hypothetical protein ACQKM2_13980 [Streptomyces sp. NPDC004126]|uniref:hypothetical protein n=1 Tax=Streptomyces sp. NPDC004126 TaxID=3390695 RepID=UPI003D03BE19